MTEKPKASLSGCRMLVVEDEMLVAIMIEDILIAAGCEVVGPVGQVEKALALLAPEAQLDAAVMDMNLAGRSAIPIAEALALRSIPFLILTGYGRSSLPERYRQAPVLSKPFDPDELIDAVRRLIDAGSQAEAGAQS